MRGPAPSRRSIGLGTWPFWKSHGILIVYVRKNFRLLLFVKITCLIKRMSKRMSTKRKSPDEEPKTIDNFLADFKENEDTKGLKMFVTSKIERLKTLTATYTEDEDEDEDEEKNRQLSDEISLLTQELHEILEKIKTYHTIEFKRLLQGEEVSQELLISLQSIITNIEGNLSGYLGGQSPRDPSKDYMCKTINLNGPVTYHYLISPDRKKRVYLFGDFHFNDKGCDTVHPKIKFIKLEELIDNTIKANSGIIDIFFETDTKKSEELVEETVIDCYYKETLEYFIRQGCFIPHVVQKLSNNCKTVYPNARFHSVDLRHIFCKGSDIQSILGGGKTDEHGYLRKIETLIDKNISKIQDPSMRQKIVSFQKKYGLADHLSYIMDTYLLARLFRSYKTPKRRDFGNVDVSNAIIYAGYSHIDYYLRFLTKLGYNVISSKVNLRIDKDGNEEYTQCMDLLLPVDDGKPFLPFFDLDPPRFRKTRRYMQNSKQNKQLQNSKSRTKQVVKSLTKRVVKSRTKQVVKSRTKRTPKSRTKRTPKSRTKQVKSRTKRTPKSRTKQVKSRTKRRV
ncbi:MAG: hypothetical protein EBS19_03065 [Spirochaetia bacterium]|nr:hypothetical protein [Spirochaetia bacterium]